MKYAIICDNRAMQALCLSQGITCLYADNGDDLAVALDELSEYDRIYVTESLKKLSEELPKSVCAFPNWSNKSEQEKLP